MEKIIINIHSVVDVITNSSTVIYTYQAGSIPPAKELVQAILDLQGIKDLTPDDVFYYDSRCNLDTYTDYINDYLEDEERDQFEAYCTENGITDWDILSYKEQNSFIESILDKVMKKELTAPTWIADAEETSDSYNPSNYLVLIPKKEEYRDLADKLLSFLNSQDNDGGYDG